MESDYKSQMQRRDYEHQTLASKYELLVDAHKTALSQVIPPVSLISNTKLD